jgi:tRNA(Ile)-lysidine synthase
MEIIMQPGKYVVAVSGGVDSMVLMDLMSKRAGEGLIIAHLDHGIRHDAHLDRRLVQEAAKRRGLQFVYDEARLGPGASEAEARRVRYEFLHKVRNSARADAIITAHHQDDLLETAVLNLIRGTGRKGLSSLKSTDIIKRPLLPYRKEELRKYAIEHGIAWREDVSNLDTDYLRNHIRHNLLPRFDEDSRQKLLHIVNRMNEINEEIDGHLINHLHLHPAVDRLDRKAFINLPHAVAREVMAHWLRRHGIRDFDRKTIERLVISGKTLGPGSRVDIIRGSQILVDGNSLALLASDR